MPFPKQGWMFSFSQLPYCIQIDYCHYSHLPQVHFISCGDHKDRLISTFSSDFDTDTVTLSLPRTNIFCSQGSKYWLLSEPNCQKLYFPTLQRDSNLNSISNPCLKLDTAVELLSPVTIFNVTHMSQYSMFTCHNIKYSHATIFYVTHMSQYSIFTFHNIKYSHVTILNIHMSQY